MVDVIVIFEKGVIVKEFSENVVNRLYVNYEKL